MSRHEEQFLIPIPLHRAMMACRGAVAALGWRVLEQSETRLVCEEVAQLASFTNPVQIEVVLSVRPQGTEVILNGSNLGFGPIQSGHVKGRVGNLRNLIELPIQQKASTQWQASPTQGSETVASEFAGMMEQLSCPACGAPLSVTEDLGDAVCDYCGSTLRLCRDSSGLIGVEIIKGLEKVRVGTDRTASELAMSRIRLELESLVAQRNALPVRPVLPLLGIGLFACMLVYLFSGFQWGEEPAWVFFAFLTMFLAGLAFFVHAYIKRQRELSQHKQRLTELIAQKTVEYEEHRDVVEQ